MLLFVCGCVEDVFEVDLFWRCVVPGAGYVKVCFAAALVFVVGGEVRCVENVFVFSVAGSLCDC